MPDAVQRRGEPHAEEIDDLMMEAQEPGPSQPESFVRRARGAGLRIVAGKPPIGGSRGTAADKEEGRLRLVRINWQIKAVLPVAFVLLNGLLLFLL